MARTENIDNAIWSKPDFSSLTPNAKLLYIWSWTNPLCGMAGLYETSTIRMETDTGLDQRAVGAALDELVEAEMVFYEGYVLWVKARVRHLKSRTSQIARSIAKDVERVDADHELRVAFLETYGSVSWLREQLEILNDPDSLPPAYISPAIRQRVLERDHYQCVDCGSTRRLTMDHITPRSHGGKATLENLATRCRSCNSSKGVRPNKDGALREPQYPQDHQEPLEVPATESRSGSESLSLRYPRATPSATVDQHSLPDGFPQDLASKAEWVLRMLGAIHGRVCRDGSPPPTLFRVGLAMKEFPSVDHEAIGHRVEMWATAPARIRSGKSVDLVTTFRTFCEGDASPGSPGRRSPSGPVQSTADFLRSFRGAA